MKKEIWKPCPGYELWYEINNSGDIRTYHFKGSGMKRRIEPVLMKPAIEKYLMIGLSKGVGRGKLKKEAVHVLVARAFVPNPFNYKWVHHKDNDKLNPASSNLEWVTPGMNQKYSYMDGCRESVKGELNGRHKLLNHQVLEIFNSKDNDYKLASIYGVTRTLVSNIKSGKAWSSVTGKKYVAKKSIVLSKEDILNIFYSKDNQIDIAKKYKVTQGRISSIKTGRSQSKITGAKFSGRNTYEYYGIKVTHGNIKKAA